MFWPRNNKSTLAVEQESAVQVMWQKLAHTAVSLQDSCAMLTSRFDRVLASHMGGAKGQVKQDIEADEHITMYA